MATCVSAPTTSLRSVAILRKWHLLSLDAPFVAALWMSYLAWQFAMPLGAGPPLALGTAVWMLYALDRILDGVRGHGREERHLIHLQHRSWFLAVCCVTAACLPPLLASLLPALRSWWMLMTVPLALYVIAVHVLALRRVPKEPVVALFFAAATASPVLAQGGSSNRAVWHVAFCFGLLCWLNCTAIARWERTLSSADPLTAWLGRNFPLGAVLVVACGCSLLFQKQTAPICIALAAAAGCLLLVEQTRTNFEAATVRALADAALLTPLVVWPIAWWLHLR